METPKFSISPKGQDNTFEYEAFDSVKSNHSLENRNHKNHENVSLFRPKYL
jgi:hypothetical protein